MDDLCDPSLLDGSATYVDLRKRMRLFLRCIITITSERASVALGSR